MARTACHTLLPALAFPFKSSFFAKSEIFCPRQSLLFHAFPKPFSSSSAKISMSLKAGIVGLPNVGKSTLFNAVVSALRNLSLEFGFRRGKMLMYLRIWVLYFSLLGMLEVEELGKIGPLLAFFFCVGSFGCETLFGCWEK